MATNHFSLLALVCLFQAGELSLNAQNAYWRPPQQVDWQLQLTETIDLSVDAKVFDIDLFDVPVSTVQALKAKGAHAICYTSVGTYEPWRPDASKFPAVVKGKPLGDFPDETWLDVRRLDILGPIIEARFDMCKARGFDGVDPDNLDGYTNKSGFPLTAADQLKFNRFVAEAAHARGLAVGLKNDLDQIKDLVDVFDWSLNEQCFQYNECNLLKPFIDAGKAVFQVEYQTAATKFCPQANALNFNSLYKKILLDAYRVPCRKAEEQPTLVTGIANAASFAPAWLAPGSVVTVFGSSLGPSTLMTMRSSTAGRVDTTLDNTRILWDGVESPIIYLSAGQSSVVVPYSTAGKSVVSVQVERNGVRSAAFPVNIAAAAPGIFTLQGNGSGQAAMLNQNGSVNSAQNAASPGDIVVFYATGEGQTSPGGVDGVITGSALSRPVLPVKVSIGGVDSEVLYAGSAPGIVAGVMQVNVRVPRVAASGTVPLVLIVGAQASQTNVTLAVKN